ncbi:hypothetical protein HJ588_05145 [Flexivirga sp. ID2601S]|uniref:GPI inositol-deacylase PGAP1-like alpha/beta domain-containing protein n=1 Tax=Flexivirga aerilata TaxID=1656889 RepID=A0A849APG8_9MICO|nr:hypothetical protein [Flexivirga aerilata]NNG38662.1 hypothetical protein [Flexivirga aerilata]
MPDTGQCRVTGGSASTEADLLDLRSTAARLDGSGDDAGDLCGAVLSVGTSLPAKSAVLSPGSAATIAEEVAGLTASLGTLRLRMEFVASGMRWSATAYELTDAAQRRALAALNAATAVPRIATAAVDSAVIAGLTADWTTSGITIGGRQVGVSHPDLGSWTDDFTDAFNHELYDDPEMTDGLVDVATVPGLARGLGFEEQIAALLFVTRRSGLFAQSRPIATRQTGTRRSAGHPRAIADLVADASSVEHASGEDRSVVRVRRTVGVDGRGAWVVLIPGTATFALGTPRGPSDLAANLESESGVPSRLYPAIERALLAAMDESGVAPGTEPVMLVGHSQGGIIAARMAADRAFRQTYDVQEVVTAGAPVSRIALPDDVHLLALEDVRDPIPRLDSRDEPDVLNRVRVQCDPRGAQETREASAAHDANRYARSTRELGRRNPDPQLQQWYGRNARWLDGDEEVFDFELTRE